MTSLSPKPGPPVDAELSLSSEPAMSDSEVENLLNEITKSPGILENVTNSPVMPVTVSSTTSASTNFHFHGCIVHIYVSAKLWGQKKTVNMFLFCVRSLNVVILSLDIDNVSRLNF